VLYGTKAFITSALCDLGIGFSIHCTFSFASYLRLSLIPQFFRLLMSCSSSHHCDRMAILRETLAPPMRGLEGFTTVSLSLCLLMLHMTSIYLCMRPLVLM
jgi:hypothetical protein